MDETRRGVVIIDIFGDEPEVEGYGSVEETNKPDSTKKKKLLPEIMPPQPTLEIVPVSPLPTARKKQSLPVPAKHHHHTN